MFCQNIVIFMFYENIVILMKKVSLFFFFPRGGWGGERGAVREKDML